MNFFKKIIYSANYRKKYFLTKFNLVFMQIISSLLISDKRDMMYRKKIYVWVPVWGDKHCNMFFDYTLPSLLQKNNLPSMTDYEVILLIYTLVESEGKIQKVLLENYSDVNYRIISSSDIGYETGDVMLAFLQDVLKKCVNEDALLVVAQPDLIFSDGSIANAVALANGKGVSIAAAHPRVSTQGISKTGIKEKLVSGEGINSKMLVKYSLDNQHSTLKYANDINDTNTTSSGISTRVLEANSMAVIHNLPAVYVAAPTKSDEKFFNRQISFNTIDKVWPAILLREMRLKYIGSSDIFFCAELTDDDDRPAKPQINLKYNDTYTGIKPFLNCANTIITSWSGEV